MGKLDARDMKSLIVAGLVLMAASLAEADDKQDKLAQQVVKTSANIKPGDVVVIAGGKHNIDLMEKLAIEVTKRGGMPTMFLNTDRLTRARFTDTPEQYLGQEQKFFAEWLKHIDVWVSLPGVEDSQTVFGGIPEERFAKRMKAYRVIWDMINAAKIRVVSIGFPTQQDAKTNGLDFATYESMHWKAVNADYRKIAEDGNRLKNILKDATSVRITSPYGTDVTLKLGNRPIFVDDGMVTEQEAKAKVFFTRLASLPGGSVTFAPIETSANGKVVIPRHRCRFEPLRDVTFEFKNGKIQDFKATTGGWCFDETLAAYTGPKDVIAFVQIGLNPELRVLETPGDYRPGDAAGMVTIGIGNNELLGGNNKNTGEFYFPITDATIELSDGRVVVRDGTLTP